MKKSNITLSCQYLLKFDAVLLCVAYLHPDAILDQTNIILLGSNSFNSQSDDEMKIVEFQLTITAWRRKFLCTVMFFSWYQQSTNIKLLCVYNGALECPISNGRWWNLIKNFNAGAVRWGTLQDSISASDLIKQFIPNHFFLFFPLIPARGLGLGSVTDALVLLENTGCGFPTGWGFLSQQ